jgi:hypothetical protein
VGIDYFSVGDLVKLSEDLFYRYDKDEAFSMAGAHSAYYAIGMKPWMVGIIVRVRTGEDYVVDSEMYMPHRFIYDVYWTGGIGLRREQHCDIFVISKV